MDFTERHKIRNVLLSKKIKCLEGIANRTFEQDYELFFTREKLRQGNDYPVISKGNKEYFDIVSREITFIEGEKKPEKVIRWFYLFGKRYYLLKEQLETGYIKKDVSFSNEKYLDHILMPLFTYKNMLIDMFYKRSRANIEARIKLYYLEEEIENRQKAIDMLKKEQRDAVSPKLFKEGQYDEESHFDEKLGKYKKIKSLLTEKLNILIGQYAKLHDKGSLQAINLQLLIFKTENRLFAQDEFIHAYKARKSIKQ